MELVFASTNPHKVQEIRDLLAPAGIRIRAATELAEQLPTPEEDADSFEGNARLKAAAYASALGTACLADDSGLEVDALGGAPGLLSARYAGVGATRAERDAANRRKLLSELRAAGEVNRTARLVCALCLADATGRVLFTTRGTVAAVIGEHEAGVHGFGYDGLLLLPDVGKTIAELPAEDWNLRSHRAIAARALVEFLTSTRANR